MDYYFQDQLRWTWGFDNPNKTAALLVTMLPLLWIAYALAWEISNKRMRRTTLIVSTIILILGWMLLLKTYSRGGIVAAAMAFCYVVWKRRMVLRWKSGRMVLAGALLMMVCSYGWLTGVAHRSTRWIGTHEGSVGNRFELWKGSLAMIASIPQGVGTGNSGLYYMQWFQPLESTSRYRSLVNSYLTFAAEQGVISFLTGIFLTALFWRITRGRSEFDQRSVFRIGLRASLIAFAVSGFFSTTMEEWSLWIVPSVAMCGLLGESCFSKQSLDWRSSIRYGVLTLILVSLTGVPAAIWFQHKTSPMISLAATPSPTVLVSPQKGTGRIMQVAVDHTVMGENEGKLLRRFAQERNIQLVVNSAADWTPRCDTILLMGSQAETLTHPGRHHCILLAPAVLPDAKADNIVREAKSLRLILPDFDEDGRVAFWKEKAGNSGRKEVTISTLDGVGTQIEWAWNAVVADWADD